MPVAGRAFVFVLEADSIELADDLLCSLPMWNHMVINVCSHDKSGLFQGNCRVTIANMKLTFNFLNLNCSNSAQVQVLAPFSHRLNENINTKYA